MHRRLREPRPIGDVLAELMARKGYLAARGAAACEAAWQAAVGEAAAHTQTGRLNRGTLEIIVANSLLMQELTFQKTELLAKLQKALPDAKIRALRFKVGPLAPADRRDAGVQESIG